MKGIKPIALLCTWSLLAFIVSVLVPGLSRLFQPRTGFFVLAFPWLLSFAGFGPGEVLRSVLDSISPNARDLPRERRRRSALLLRRLGSLSLSAGIVAFLISALAAMTGLAVAGGAFDPLLLMGEAPVALVAPLFGYMLDAFVYRPLAAILEAENSGLGLELDG